MSSGPDTCNSQWALLLVVIRNKKNADCWTALTCFGESKYWTAVYLTFDQMGNLSQKRRRGPKALLSNQRESCAVLSAQCTHLCTRLGNYQLCTLSFTVVANFFLDSHPWQTNPHSIRIILEDNHWWHSRRLINEASREKTDHFQKSHLT